MVVEHPADEEDRENLIKPLWLEHNQEDRRRLPDQHHRKEVKRVKAQRAKEDTNQSNEEVGSKWAMLVMIEKTTLSERNGQQDIAWLTITGSSTISQGTKPKHEGRDVEHMRGDLLSSNTA